MVQYNYLVIGGNIYCYSICQQTEPKMREQISNFISKSHDHFLFTTASDNRCMDCYQFFLILSKDIWFESTSGGMAKWWSWLCVKIWFGWTGFQSFSVELIMLFGLCTLYFKRLYNILYAVFCLSIHWMTSHTEWCSALLGLRMRSADSLDMYPQNWMGLA